MSRAVTLDLRVLSLLIGVEYLHKLSVRLGVRGDHLRGQIANGAGCLVNGSVVTLADGGMKGLFS